MSYGNATHLNISIVVSNDNKPIILAALDRRNKDYFACDAGCLGENLMRFFMTKNIIIGLLFSNRPSVQADD